MWEQIVNNSAVFFLLVGVIVGVVVVLLSIFFLDRLYWVMERRVRSGAKITNKQWKELSASSGVLKEKTVDTVDTPIDDVIPEPVYHRAPTQDDAPPVVVARPGIAQRYQYFVSGNKEPFATLRDALKLFPAEDKKYKDNDRYPEWDRLPKYVRENIRREKVVN